MKITRQGPVDSDGNLLDEEGEVKEQYDPDKKLNIIHVFYWYDDFQGRLKQELRPPSFYLGKPRIFVKESVEKLGENELLSHLRVYYGKKLLAETERTLQEYTPGMYIADEGVSYHENEGSRTSIRTTVTYLLHEGGWKLYTFDKKRFRKVKKSKSKTRKPIVKSTKKVKKIVRKKILKKRK